MELKIEYVGKEDLKPYANNAKIHTAEQIEQIKKSIKEFGFNDPIAVWHDNEIVEGHGRLLAAMEMDEIETVPVIRLDDLTDEQRKAYMLAHNKLTMNTGFDLDLLKIEIADIVDSFDLTNFGFNEREILELTIDDSPEEIPSYSSNDNKDVFTENGSERVSDSEFLDGMTTTSSGGVTREEFEEYESRAESLVTRRVIIVFRTDEEEAFVKKLLGVPAEETLNVIYLAEKMMTPSASESEYE